MPDKFQNQFSTLDSPAKNAYNVTPNDAANVAFTSRALYVGNTGNVNVIMAGDAANTLFPYVPAGSMLAIRVNKIWATGTTANNIVVLY